MDNCEICPLRSDNGRRRFLLQIIQPGLIGLIDGSVATLAPVFAAAFASRNSWVAFVVGLSASIGAAISMAVAEAISDDGAVTGRGHPWIRGLICGGMTLLGGLGHTLPFLLREFRMATAVAAVAVVAELALITWIRHRFMGQKLLFSAFVVTASGALVLAVGILLGSS